MVASVPVNGSTPTEAGTTAEMLAGAIVTPRPAATRCATVAQLVASWTMFGV